MIGLNLKTGSDQPLEILCIGAHSDDIEIGCGGTILRLAEEYPACVIHWVVLSAAGVRGTEAQRGAELFAGARLKGPTLKTFRDGFLPFEGTKVKEVFEDLKLTVFPNVILTHSRKDAHQDHRLIGEMTWNTFRDHMILEYEIPKYDGDIGQPCVFVPLERDVCKKKIDYLFRVFHSQRNKGWFAEDTFLSLMRLRGMECQSQSGFAEAFYCRKLVL